MARFALEGLPVDVTVLGIPVPEGWPLPFDDFFIPVLAFWFMLIAQIVAYLSLAVLAETKFHGINFQERTLSVSASAQGLTTPGPAVQTTGLTKVYSPWLKRLFGLRDDTGTKALDGLELVAHQNQILCLLGVNGAGKSTTLDLLSGFQTPTAGEMAIRASPSKLGWYWS